MCMSYDGTEFYGWQKQPEHSPTIQETLEQQLSKIFDTQIAVVGSGRTDRGVHALNQWAHFDVPADKDTSNLGYRLHRLTPPTIHIKQMESVPAEFHAQISAEKKRYIYRMFCRPRANPFLLRYSWNYRYNLDMNFLQDAASFLIGEHDFSSFQSVGTSVSTPRRTIYLARWVQRPSGFLDFHIEGNGFLKQMVRNIVGTMMWLHEKKAKPEAIRKILEACNRQQAGPPAPAQGLFLAKVKYPAALDNKCRKL